MYKNKTIGYIQNSVHIMNQIHQLENTKNEKYYDLKVLFTLGSNTQERYVQQYIRFLMIGVIDRCLW